MKYRDTRHNVGFMTANFYIKTLGLRWKNDKKFGAEVTRLDDDVIFAKPQLYYNLTGQVVQKVMSFYKIDIDDLLVVCDDLNVDFGQVRVRASGSAGGNNGLKSIIDQIGDEFKRIRIGTHNDDTRNKSSDSAFVLSKFSRAEQKLLPNVFETTINFIESFMADNFAHETIDSLKPPVKSKNH